MSNYNPKLIVKNLGLILTFAPLIKAGKPFQSKNIKSLKPLFNKAFRLGF